LLIGLVNRAPTSNTPFSGLNSYDHTLKEKGEPISMGKPLLVIVNGLPGTGKTTLARRLAADIPLPVFSRDGMFETLYDALECQSNGCPPLMGHTSYTLLYYVAGSILAAGQSLVVEAFFGRPELRTADLLRLQHAADFEPLQIVCKADGRVLVERFLARMEDVERHVGHSDPQWIEQNKARLLQGQLTPLALGGPIIEIDTTTPDNFDYTDLLGRVRVALSNTRTG
jgi:predicted kinase